ncbi:MAG: winged helix-turn-helix transcriptional regulator [Salinigranum sp.]
MTETRDRIAAYVRENPGVHFNDLVRDLDLAPGQVQYHLRRLRRGDDVDSEHLYGRTHYYPPAFDEWERRALALVRRETSRDVLGYLLERDEADPESVAEAVGIARSTLEWHLDHLVAESIVEKRYDERGRVTLTLARPEATARLLAAVSPSLPERFVDRFERLLDDLLAGVDR